MLKFLDGFKFLFLLVESFVMLGTSFAFVLVNFKSEPQEWFTAFDFWHQQRPHTELYFHLEGPIHVENLYLVHQKLEFNAKNVIFCELKFSWYRSRS